MTDQGVEGFGVAGFVLFYRLGVGGDDAVDDAFEFAGVAHLFEAFGFDDGVNVFALACPKRIKHLLGSVVGNGVVGNTTDQLAQ